MLLHIPSLINNAINDQLALKLVDICLDNNRIDIMQINCCYAFKKFGRLQLTTENCQNLAHRIYLTYLTQISTDFKNLDLKI